MLWNEKAGAFFDFDWQRDRQRTALTAATAAPLFAGVACDQQAAGVTAALREHLLDDGGLGTSEHQCGEQWDRPNGWAPLQWMAICGLARYKQESLARDIGDRWLQTVASLYHHQGKLVEKYLLEKGDGAAGGGGGEYPLQDGFGWTNGVTRKLLDDNPQHLANDCRRMA